MVSYCIGICQSWKQQWVRQTKYIHVLLWKAKGTQVISDTGCHICIVETATSCTAKGSQAISKVDITQFTTLTDSKVCKRITTGPVSHVKSAFMAFSRWIIVVLGESYLCLVSSFYYCKYLRLYRRITIILWETITDKIPPTSSGGFPKRRPSLSGEGAPPEGG